MRNQFVLSSFVEKSNDMYSVLFFDQDNIAPHSHDFFEFVYVLEGNAEHTLNGITNKVSAGNYYIIDIGAVHSYESRDNFKIINILFDPSFLDEAFHDTFDSKKLIQKAMLRFCHIDIQQFSGFQCFTDEDGQIKELFTRIMWEFRQKLPCFTENIRFMLLQAFIMIIRQSIQSQPLGLVTVLPYKTAVKEAIAFIDKNYSSAHLLKDFCEEYHYAPEHISRVFHSQTGITFTVYTQKCRIETALNLLKQTDLSVADIASEVGYQDIKCFQSVFKKLTGTTPSECRKLQMK